MHQVFVGVFDLISTGNARVELPPLSLLLVEKSLVALEPEDGVSPMSLPLKELERLPRQRYLAEACPHRVTRLVAEHKMLESLQLCLTDLVASLDEAVVLA